MDGRAAHSSYGGCVEEQRERRADSPVSSRPGPTRDHEPALLLRTTTGWLDCCPDGLPQAGDRLQEARPRPHRLGHLEPVALRLRLGPTSPVQVHPPRGARPPPRRGGAARARPQGAGPQGAPLRRRKARRRKGAPDRHHPPPALGRCGRQEPLGVGRRRRRRGSRRRAVQARGVQRLERRVRAPPAPHRPAHPPLRRVGQGPPPAPQGPRAHRGAHRRPAQRLHARHGGPGDRPRARRGRAALKRRQRGGGGRQGQG